MNEVLEIRKQRLAELAKQRVSTPVATIANYDVVGAAVKVFDQAVADAKIGNHYELVGAMYQALDSCNTCGYPVKPGFVTCSKCAGC